MTAGLLSTRFSRPVPKTSPFHLQNRSMLSSEKLHPAADQKDADNHFQDPYGIEGPEGDRNPTERLTVSKILDPWELSETEPPKSIHGLERGSSTFVADNRVLSGLSGRRCVYPCRDLMCLVGGGTTLSEKKGREPWERDSLRGRLGGGSFEDVTK